MMQKNWLFLGLLILTVYTVLVATVSYNMGKGSVSGAGTAKQSGGSGSAANVLPSTEKNIQAVPDAK